jgi:hypothetical protein
MRRFCVEVNDDYMQSFPAESIETAKEVARGVFHESGATTVVLYDSDLSGAERLLTLQRPCVP